MAGMSSAYPEPTPLVPRRPAAPRPVPPFPGADQRIGDAERSAVCEQLSAHYAAGRLTDEELDTRVSEAVVARTWGDLRALVGDLPLPTPAAPPAPVPVPIGRPWPTVDVFALVALVGAVALALLGAFGVIGSGQPGYIVVCTLTAFTAGVGGMALTQMLHRWRRSIVDRAAAELRAQQAAPGPAPRSS
jgi:hypothetical protein